jgi:hypothetical protein
VLPFLAALGTHAGAFDVDVFAEDVADRIGWQKTVGGKWFGTSGLAKSVGYVRGCS